MLIDPDKVPGHITLVGVKVILMAAGLTMVAVLVAVHAFLSVTVTV